MKPRVDPEFARLAPPLSEEERVQLEANLLRDGCRDPLVVWKDNKSPRHVLLDGHHRLAICEEHGLAYQTTAVEVEDRDAALLWIIANQRGRRNLTPFAKAELGLKYMEIEKRKAKARQGRRTDLKPNFCPDSDRSVERADERAAAAVGVSRDTLRRAEYLTEHAEAETLAELRAGGSSVNREYQRLKRQEHRESLKETSPLPSDTYRVIYADPPWPYGNSGALDSGGYGRAEQHYPTMSIDDLCGLDVKGLADDDAVLFLWVTSPLLPEVWPVIKAWGFKYKACFVWDKVRHNFGHYNSVRHEFLFICTRGSCLPSGGLEDSVVEIERGSEHSAKPEYFRELIDRLYPDGRRIELFARTAAKGWDRWGNEAG